MTLVLTTLAVSALCMMGLALGMLMQREGLQRSCGGTVDYVDGRFVREACGTCKLRGHALCPKDEGKAAPEDCADDA
jgi:hypothetical protein